MNFDTDLHIHTYHSPCGRDEMLPGDILRIAAERGMRHVGITDHLYTFTNLADFDAVREEFAEAVEVTQNAPRISFGCEVEIMAPGRTAGSEEIARRFDFVMIAATHFGGVPDTSLPDTTDLREIADYYVRMFEYAVTLPWANVLAHPFFVRPDVCTPDILPLISDAQLLPGIEMARENNIAMEISRRVFATPQQREFLSRYYRLCKRVGLKFTTGSDAHTLGDVGNVGILREVVGELGLAGSHFWRPA